MRPGLALLAAFLVLQLLPVPAQGDWASFRGDALNSGAVRSDYEVYKEVLWSEKGGGALDKQVVASPVVKDGRLIVADRGGNVRALDIQSGYEYWLYKMPAPIKGTPAISGDHVYVADEKGNLKSLNLFDGRVEAERAIGATEGNIAEHEGKIFVGTEAGEMKAFLADLTPLWSWKASESLIIDPTNPAKCAGMSNQPIRGKPAIYAGKVYFGSLNHHMYALSEGGNGDGTNRLLWKFKAGDVFVGAPSVLVRPFGSVPARIFVGSYDGHFYAFNPSYTPAMLDCPESTERNPKLYMMPIDAPVWRYRIPDTHGQVTKVFSSPATADGRVFFGANNGLVYALNATNGRELWNRTAGSDITPVKSSPAVANGIVVIGSDDKNVYWLSADRGEVLKTFTAQALIQTSPALEGRMAFVGAFDGTWYAFAPEKPPRSDLVVSSLTATTTVVTAEVRNVGAVASEATQLRFLHKGAFLVDADVPAIDPGGTHKVTQPATVVRGKAIFSALVDRENRVLEADESNNRVSLEIDVKAPPAPPPSATQATSTEKSPGWALAAALVVLGLGASVRRRRST